MFGLQDSALTHPHAHHPHHQPRGPSLKEEPLASQLGSVRSWMNSTMVEQNIPRWVERDGKHWVVKEVESMKKENAIC